MSLSDFITQHEVAVRLGFFFTAFGLIALWDELVPPIRTIKAVN